LRLVICTVAGGEDWTTVDAMAWPEGESEEGQLVAAGRQMIILIDPFVPQILLNFYS